MVYSIVSAFMRFVLGLLSDCRVTGLENVPRQGPLIVISNHCHNIDPVLIGAVFPRRIRFMAKYELFHVPIFRHLVKWYGTFPVHRGEPDRKAIREAIGVVNSGGVLGLFPEGQRSRTGHLQHARPGVALIALRSAAPIVPIALRDTDSALKNIWRRPRIEVIIGEPFYVTDDGSSRRGMKKVADEMMCHVADLLPEEERGYYQVTAREKMLEKVQ